MEPHMDPLDPLDTIRDVLLRDAAQYHPEDVDHALRVLEAVLDGHVELAGLAAALIALDQEPEAFTQPLEAEYQRRWTAIYGVDASGLTAEGRAEIARLAEKDD